MNIKRGKQPSKLVYSDRLNPVPSCMSLLGDSQDWSYVWWHTSNSRPSLVPKLYKAQQFPLCFHNKVLLHLLSLHLYWWTLEQICNVVPILSQDRYIFFTSIIKQISLRVETLNCLTLNNKEHFEFC